MNIDRQKRALRTLAVHFLGRFGLLLLILSSANVSQAQQTRVGFWSWPGEWLGNGVAYFYTPEAKDFKISSVQAWGKGYITQIKIDLAGGEGKPPLSLLFRHVDAAEKFAPGVYPLKYDQFEPNMFFLNSGSSGASQSNGEFIVSDAAFDADHTHVTRLSISFLVDRSRKDNRPSMAGMLQYNSAVTPALEFPPFITATASSQPDSLLNWYTQPVQLSLRAAQAGLPVVEPAIFYQINKERPKRYKQPLRFKKDGVYVVRYWAVDAKNRQTEAQTQTIQYDVTPPWLTIHAKIVKNTADATTVRVWGQVGDRMAGMRLNEVVIQIGGEGAAYLLPQGTPIDKKGNYSRDISMIKTKGEHSREIPYKISLTVQDAAGNSASASTAVSALREARPDQK